MNKWGVWAVRKASSIFGPAESWVKRDGVLLTYETESEAKTKAIVLRKNIATPNLEYFPMPIS